MSNINIWDKYKEISKIGYGTYDKVYKVQFPSLFLKFFIFLKKNLYYKYKL